MTDLNKLRVSLTKHGAHKTADLIKAFPGNEILANTWDQYQGIRIDLAQTKSNLSAYHDATLPYIWDEVRQLGDEYVNDLVLLAIIFSHHRLIETMISASTGEKRGTVTRGQVIGDKEYTNFACILDELGFATEHYPQRVSYDLSRIFRKFELIPLIVQLLTLKVRAANWDGNTDFIDECIVLDFHKVFGITEEYFRKWLQEGTISEIVYQDETVEDEPDITDFNFRSGHVQKSEADVVINKASPKLKATLLHHKVQNKLHHYPKIRNWFYANHCISPSQAEKTV